MPVATGLYRHPQEDLAGRLAQALGDAKQEGREWRALCPCHNGRPRLSLRNTDEGRLLVHCFADCDSRDILAELRRRGLLDDRQRDWKPRGAEPKPEPHQDKLRWLLKQLRPIEGTPVATYLDSRGLDLPPDGHGLRYLPARSNLNLAIRDGGPGTILVFCHSHGCSGRQILAAIRRFGGLDDRSPCEAPRIPPSEKDSGNRLRIARWLWRCRQPIEGSIAERYLNGVRGLEPPWPPTLAFKPADNGYPPALIAAFGIPDEPQPGVLNLPESRVDGVQLLELGADARKLGAKTVGHCLGTPFVAAPMGDGLALGIAEGVEDALSVASLGLGAWAAAGAGRLPALAATVPTCTDWITVFEDDDPVGRQNVDKLARALLHRGCWRAEQIERARLR